MRHWNVRNGEERFYSGEIREGRKDFGRDKGGNKSRSWKSESKRLRRKGIGVLYTRIELLLVGSELQREVGGECESSMTRPKKKEGVGV